MRIGITMGDPRGIGPEVIVKALSSEALRKRAAYLIFGNRQILERAIREADSDIELSAAGEARPPGNVELEAIELPELENCTPGRVSPQAGRASADYVFAGIERALSGGVDALVTAPISKESLAAAGFAFRGHTEMLSARTGSREVLMMFVAGALRVGIATRHVPLRKVPGLLTFERVRSTIGLVDKALRELFGIERPTVGVGALNPHGGEGGMLGSEETRVIAPAIESARSSGIRCEGPIPADALFLPETASRFDGLVAMYHDQALIPLKSAHRNQLVNLTVGLPFVRTSPGHGTAFEIAGKGLADASSMIAAIELACLLSERVSGKKAKNLELPF